MVTIHIHLMFYLLECDKDIWLQHGTRGDHGAHNVLPQTVNLNLYKLRQEEDHAQDRHQALV